MSFLDRFLVRLFRLLFLPGLVWLMPGGSSAGAAEAILPRLQSIKRIVFLGDSITQGGDYIADVTCWLLSQGQSVEVLNLGLSSETATDLTTEENAGHLKKFGFGHPFVSERLGRLLEATKPDLVFVCYGMNDGGSLPADETGTRRFAQAVTGLREAILRAGAKQVVLLTPPVREARADGWDSNVHDQNLERYTAWLLGQRTEGWTVVDIHTPMRRALDENRARDAAFNFTQDGVHPGREGHWFMASCVIGQFFGAKLDGVTGGEQFFPVNGPKIRELVKERQKLIFDAWMTKIGHQRPKVPGGPGATPGPELSEIEPRVAALTEAIARLR